MAVELKTGLTIKTLIQGLWPAEEAEEAQGGIYALATELETADYQLRVGPSTLTIMYVIGSGAGVGITQCDIKAETLKLALQKKVGYAVKSALKKKITTLIDNAHKYHQKHIKVLGMDQFKAEVMVVYQPAHATISNKVAAIKKLRELSYCSLKEAYDKVEEWIDEGSSVFPGGASLKHKAKTFGDLVKEQQEKVEAEAAPLSTAQENPMYKTTKSHIMDLCEAKHLHQAVHGTSPGSRYYVIALGDDVRVAARIKSEADISIRAICTKAPQSHAGQKVKVAFERAGLAKAKDGHWSLHLKPNNMVMAERSIGSTLFAMGVPFWAVTGQLSVLVGK